MKMSAQAFRAWKSKAITLLAMSGAGKTTLASKLPKQKWFHYSGDYRIGTKYLEEAILDDIKAKAMAVPCLRELLLTDSIYIRNNITVDNLAPISSFLGKVGKPECGGLPLAEFKRRQRLHRQAEIAAMLDVPEFMHKAKTIYGYANFINDAGGSLCELDSPEVIASLVQHTLIVYLDIPDSLQQTIIERAKQHPKPLYFNENFLDAQLAAFLQETGCASSEQMVPDAFARWVFPKLVAYRQPRYQQLAQAHGYTISAEHANQVRDEQDFIDLIATAIDAQQAPASPVVS
ncbi:MAG: ATPase [Methylococcales bacterium]|nr:ATPase [Methylococcales bacterium]